MRARALEQTKREYEVWPSRFSGDLEDQEEISSEEWECPCGCGSYSRGGGYLRGHERIHLEKIKNRKAKVRDF
jgi:hypothetical protein